MSRRDRWAWVSAGLGGLLLFLGLVAGLAHQDIADGGRFAEKVNAMRHDPAVATQLADTITHQIIHAAPNLVALQPLVNSAVRQVVASSAFDPIVTATARDLHGNLISGSPNGVVVRLADVGAVLTAVLPMLSSQTSGLLPSDMSVTLARFGEGWSSREAIRFVHITGLLSWLLPLLALIALLGAVVLSRDRWRGVSRAGTVVLGAGVLLAVLSAVTTIVVGTADTNTMRGALISAAWDQLRGDVLHRALVVGVAGVLVVAASAAGTTLERWLADIRQWGSRAARPRTPIGRVLRGLPVAAVGIVFILRPTASLIGLAIAVGIVAAAWGVAEVAAAVAAMRPEPSPGAEPGEHLLAAESTAGETVSSPRAAYRLGLRRGRLVSLGAVLVASVVVAAMLAWQAAPASSKVPTAASDQACNGSVLLCSRRYNDVAFPAAHNAMSAADESGWFLAEQPTGIIGSLNGGIRVLLIDSYYGQSTKSGGRVATAQRSLKPAVAEARAAFGDEVVNSALRIRDSIVSAPAGPVEPYLCHGMCELGATKWLPVMKQVRTWMALHPREVVTFFIEDYVDPADTAKLFREAGLLPYVHVQKVGQPWPTLGQMINSGHRLVVLLEKHEPDKQYPWLLPGFELTQDTPYTNPTLAGMSCTLQRGSPDNSLLLINAWLAGFSSLVTDAQKVNRVSFLGPYTRRCERERGQIPNFVAVNFWNEGNVFKVVDNLNGLP